MTEIYSVEDPSFAAYGRVWHDADPAACAAIVEALSEKTPLPEGVGYVSTDPALQELPAAETIAPTLFGGLPVEFGWCNGHNNSLNGFEYHRSSEFNLGATDFVLLVGRQQDIVDGKIDAATTRAYRVPAGVLVELYTTTLHYAPCQVDEGGFKVLIALPAGTNEEMPELTSPAGDAGMLRALNKWLIAHPQSAEASDGAHVGIVGENPSIPERI